METKRNPNRRQFQFGSSTEPDLQTRNLLRRFPGALRPRSRRWATVFTIQFNLIIVMVWHSIDYWSTSCGRLWWLKSERLLKKAVRGIGRREREISYVWFMSLCFRDFPLLTLRSLINDVSALQWVQAEKPIPISSACYCSHQVDQIIHL